jgi:hypothetical protein
MLLLNSCTGRYYEQLAMQQAESARQTLKAAQDQLRYCKESQRRMELMYMNKIDSLVHMIDSLKLSK